MDFHSKKSSTFWLVADTSLSERLGIPLLWPTIGLLLSLSGPRWTKNMGSSQMMVIVWWILGCVLQVALWFDKILEDGESWVHSMLGLYVVVVSERKVLEHLFKSWRMSEGIGRSLKGMRTTIFKPEASHCDLLISLIEMKQFGVS